MERSLNGVFIFRKMLPSITIAVNVRGCATTRGCSGGRGSDDTRGYGVESSDVGKELPRG